MCFLTRLFIKANILIDRGGHARLADFGLPTLVSDSPYPTSSSLSADTDTARWISPELLDPDRFDFENRRPTRGSDCYALGMTVLEVLSGQVPFPYYEGSVAARKVVGGECPGRPQGAEGVWFTDELWEVLEFCWSSQPKNRPTIEVILGCLNQVSIAWYGNVEANVGDEPCPSVIGPGTSTYSVPGPGLTVKEKVSGSWMPPSPWSSAIPSASGSHTRGSSDAFSAESTDLNGAFPPSQVAPSQPPDKSNPEGSAGIFNVVGGPSLSDLRY